MKRGHEIRRFIGRLFVENAGLKVVAIVFAVALYFVAREETIREVEIDVPVVVSAGPDDRVLTSQPPGLLRVRIRGNLQKLTDVLARRTPYELDLSTFEDNQTAFFLPETMGNHLGEGVKVLSISPSSFNVRIDKMVTKRVPVRVDIARQPGAYWQVAREHMEIQPQFVEVTGPGKLLASITKVHTESLDLSAVTKDFQGRVAVESREKLKLNPASVQVFVPIREKEGEKFIRGAKIQVRSCPEGYSCEASPIFFEARIVGRERLVDMVNNDNVSRYVYIDASKLPLEEGLLQKHFPAVEPAIERLKGAEISLPKARYFNVTVTRN